MLKDFPWFRNNEELIETADNLLFVLNEMKEMNNKGEKKEYIEYKGKKYKVRKEIDLIENMIEYLETVKEMTKDNKKVPKEQKERDNMAWNFAWHIINEDSKDWEGLMNILRVTDYFGSGYIFNPPSSIVLEGIEDE